MPGTGTASRGSFNFSIGIASTSAATARARGHDEIRELLSAFLARFPDAHWRDATHFVAGEHGASEWIFTGTDSGGNRVELDACDLFTFRNGRIALVSAYRRNRS
jgi:ketosteroid isomerase-like protein